MTTRTWSAGSGGPGRGRTWTWPDRSAARLAWFATGLGVPAPAAASAEASAGGVTVTGGATSTTGAVGATSAGEPARRSRSRCRCPSACRLVSRVSYHGRNAWHSTQNWAPGSFRVPHCSQMFSSIRPPTSARPCQPDRTRSSTATDSLNHDPDRPTPGHAGARGAAPNDRSRRPCRLRRHGQLDVAAGCQAAGQRRGAAGTGLL